MGKIKMYLISLFLLTFTGCNLFVHSWTYRELPNDYVLKKLSDTKMVVGKYINNHIETERKLVLRNMYQSFKRGSVILDLNV